MAKQRMKAPQHLKRTTKGWWQSVTEEFELSGHHLKLLLLACEAWDMKEAARLAIAELGMTYLDRFGQPHARPEVAVERDCRIGFARLLRELSLDIEAPPELRLPTMAGRK